MAYAVTLEKGKNNMIGISIGGGAPYCPVVYIVQVRSRKMNNTTLLCANSNFGVLYNCHTIFSFVYLFH